MISPPLTIFKEERNETYLRADRSGKTKGKYTVY